MATRLVALLRGINVGRGKRVAMADLRRLLAGMGYTDITTYLQSGTPSSPARPPMPPPSPRASSRRSLVT